MRLRDVRLGPGVVVAAAFIGPGTITTATVAGVDYGLALVWALVFAVVATLVLQEMSVRLGLVGQMGLGEAMRRRFGGGLLRLGHQGDRRIRRHGGGWFRPASSQSDGY